MRHALEYALFHARKSGKWDGVCFIVPSIEAGAKYGLSPGRYISRKDGRPVLEVDQTASPGDLRLH